MKLYIFLFLSVFCLTNIFGQAAKEEEKLELSGNLKTDITAVNKLITESPKLQMEVNRKSPVLAVLLSAVVPGAGQYYTEEYWRVPIYLAIEAVAIAANIYYNKKGDDATRDFKNYADQHWSVVRYAEWLNSYATTLGATDATTIYIDPDETKSPWDRVNFKQVNSVEELISTFSHRLVPYGEQQYYELIGKYKQYNHGWDTSDPTTSEYLTNVPQQMIDFSAMFCKPDETYYKYASMAVGAIIINHIVSAVDAALSTHKYNKRISANVSIKKAEYFGYIDFYPELNLNIRL